MQDKTNKSFLDNLIVAYTTEDYIIKKIIGHLSGPNFFLLHSGRSVKDFLEIYLSKKETTLFFEKLEQNNTVTKYIGQCELFAVKSFIPGTSWMFFVRNTPLDQSTLKEYLVNVVRYTPGFMYLKDVQCKYVMCNENFAKVAGLKSAEEVVGKTDYDLVWAQTQADLFKKGDLDALAGVEQINIEIPQLQSDGSTKIVLSNKVPLYDVSHKIIGILGNYLDITDRIKMEEELKITKKAAEVANEAKSEFLRNMEHQLRTPFSGVYSMVETLASMEEDPDKKQMLDLTYQSAKEFYELLNNIIDFSRFQVDRTAVLEKKINLKNIIEKAITMERAAATVKKLEIIFIYPDTTPEFFISDEIRLERIILNLLSNAIKFTDKGYIKIQVKLAKEENNKNIIMQIIISDTGIGIAEDKQQLIYERFYREYPANQNKYGGAGLGLHIVKQLIEDLNGEIAVVSANGKGSAFTCTLPLKRPLLDAL